MRTFISALHLIDLDDAAWLNMRDEYDNVLDGIRGKAGACSESMSGYEIGVDLIEMACGSAFPAHVHDGDHLLVFIEGQGCVSIDGKRYHVKANDSIVIAAELPHAVSAPSSPCAFLAFGHPHKRVDALDRMTIVEDDYEETARG